MQGPASFDSIVGGRLAGGLPAVGCDQGSQFKSRGFKAFITQWQASHVMANPYYRSIARQTIPLPPQQTNLQTSTAVAQSKNVS